MNDGAKRPAGVFRPAEAVAYQPGAIVSRTLSKGGKGSVTVFAFDAGEALDPHSAPFEALIQVLEGEAQVTLSGAPHALMAGDCLLMPANAPHAVHAAARFKMLLTLLPAK
ncbi:MAG: cupin domain-containing protein [Elusimicrobia bacterium]|nr:cupin domain-containing protein [Elusimicrobiota bacterium]